MTGQGVFVVSDLNAKYELVNLGKNPVFLNACNIQRTVSNSYFTSVLATIVFMRLDGP